MSGLAPNSANAALSGPLFDASLSGGLAEELASGAKASGLSLEAKQRLAAKSEQAGKLHKVAQSGAPGAMQPSALVPRAKPQPKDLTSTLMERNLASMAICAPPQPTSNSTALVPLSTALRPHPQSNVQAQQRPVDMSALDNLLGPSNSGQTRSLNEMRALTYPGFQAAPGGPGPRPTGPANFGGPNQPSAGFGGPAQMPSGFGGPTNQMPSGFGGPNQIPSGFGGPTNQMSGGFGGPGQMASGFCGPNQGGMQGRTDALGGGASPLAQFQQQQQQRQTTPVSNNDLNDLLG